MALAYYRLAIHIWSRPLPLGLKESIPPVPEVLISWLVSAKAGRITRHSDRSPIWATLGNFENRRICACPHAQLVRPRASVTFPLRSIDEFHIPLVLFLAIPGLPQNPPVLPPLPSYFVISPQAQLKPNYTIYEVYGEAEFPVPHGDKTLQRGKHWAAVLTVPGAPHGAKCGRRHARPLEFLRAIRSTFT
jgi:hypothetical protein